LLIICTGPGTFKGDKLKTGFQYEVLEYETPTEKQNRLFHSLLQEYWASGAHSYNAKNFPQFKKLIKRDLGTYKNKSWAKYSKKERQETIYRLISTMLQSEIYCKRELYSRKFDEILKSLSDRSDKKAHNGI